MALLDYNLVHLPSDRQSSVCSKMTTPITEEVSAYIMHQLHKHRSYHMNSSKARLPLLFVVMHSHFPSVFTLSCDDSVHQRLQLLPQHVGLAFLMVLAENSSTRSRPARYS